MKRVKKILIFTAVLVITIAMSGIRLPAGDDRAVYEVYLQYTGIRTEYSGIEDVEAAINEICVPAIGVKLHIVPVFIGNLPADTAYAVAGGEKIDILLCRLR